MRYTQEYIEQKKREIPQVAFQLFAENGIEAVSMQNIADACNYGVATLYRYYGTKLNLVIKICAEQWTNYAMALEKEYDRIHGENFNAYEELSFYLDNYINLYQNHKDLLKFNSNFDLFVVREQASVESMKPYYESVKFYTDFFRKHYAKAFTDHTIRTDIPEDKLYFGLMYAMLSAATKFAYGTIYPYETELDYTYALEHQKKSYLNYMSDPKVLEQEKNADKSPILD